MTQYSPIGPPVAKYTVALKDGYAPTLYAAPIIDTAPVLNSVKMNHSATLASTVASKPIGPPI